MHASRPLRISGTRRVAEVLPAGLRHGLAAYRAWRRRVADTEHLRELPDYLLDDVGMRRSELGESRATGHCRTYPGAPFPGSRILAT